MNLRDMLPALAVRRPVTVGMLFVAICVLGVLAVRAVPLQMMPSGLSAPYIWVWFPYPGSTPLETERSLVQPVEEQLATISGVKVLGSRAAENYANFSLEFHQSVDLDEAYNAVVDRLERARAELPDDVDFYGVYRFNPDDEPIQWVGISLPDELEEGAHELMTTVVQKRLERVSGVGKIEVWGTDPNRLFIDFDRDALFAHGVSLYELMQKLATDNFQLASGRITDRGQRFYVRSLGRYDDVDALRDTQVKPGVTLSDVAEVGFRKELSASINHIDGTAGVFVAVYKESSGNTVQVAEDSRQAFAELVQDPRTGAMKTAFLFDQGKLITESIENLVITALQGGAFAVVILFLFLREVRMTLLIAACIPFSLLLTVTTIHYTGGSLNLLSLLGLMIAVGMVVDNAIVVVETIHRRRQAGSTPKQAAVEGTGEVNLAITLSTMTTMVVFLPVILMSDDAMFSFFFGAMGFPVVFALAASLLAALVFTPLGTLLLPDRQVAEDPKAIQWLARHYRRALARVLARPMDGFITLASVILVTVLIPGGAVSCSDESDSNFNDFTVGFEVPSSFTYTERLDVVEKLEEMVEDHRESWGVEVHRARLSAGSTRGFLNVRLFEDETIGIPRDEVVEQVEALIPEKAGVRTWMGWGSSGSRDRNTSISLRVEGPESETLLGLAEEMLVRLRQQPVFLNAEHTLESSGNEELRLAVDRDAANRYGLSAATVGRTLAFAMRGQQLPDYYEGSREVDVYARFRIEDRADFDRLMDFPMWSPLTQEAVPVRAVTEQSIAKGFGNIERTDRKTGMTLNMELAPDVEMAAAWAGAGAALDGMQFPRGYGWAQGREMEQQQEDDRARNLALGLSIVLVFLIMGVLLESFLLPLAILTTIPMALLGVWWTLYFTGTPVDAMAGVGLVILIGVVVNNGIVLLDLVTQLRREGLDRTEALLTAGTRRLRPILMTALTTICGLLPMAVGDRTFIGIPYAPLGQVVAGGLATATVLTLFVLPYLYALLDDLRSASWRALVFAWPASGVDAGAETPAK